MNGMDMMSRMGGGQFMGGGPYGWPIVAELLGVLVLALVIVGIIYAAKTIAAGPDAGVSGPTGRGALDELKLRYARGDIGRDEYEEKKHDILATP